MNIYLQLLLLDLVIIFITDLSGALDSKDGLVAILTKKLLGIRRDATIKLPHIISCSLCQCWWIGLIYIIITGEFSILNIAFVALLSYLSTTLGSLLILLKNLLDTVISKLYRKL